MTEIHQEPNGPFPPNSAGPGVFVAVGFGAKRADQAADEDVGFGSELSRYITGVRGLPFSISAISTFLSNRRPSADAEGLVSSFLLIRR